MEALEARQDAILTRLEELKEQVKAYKKSLGLSDLPPPKVSPTIFVTVGLYFFLACFLCD